MLLNAGTTLPGDLESLSVVLRLPLFTEHVSAVGYAAKRAQKALRARIMHSHPMMR
jgi:hypothetical protein